MAGYWHFKKKRIVSFRNANINAGCAMPNSIPIVKKTIKSNPWLGLKTAPFAIKSVPLPLLRVDKTRSTLVTNETVEKRIALPISWLPEHIPSMIIGAPMPYVVVIIPLTYKAVFSILPS